MRDGDRLLIPTGTRTTAVSADVELGGKNRIALLLKSELQRSRRRHGSRRIVRFIGPATYGKLLPVRA